MSLQQLFDNQGEHWLNLLRQSPCPLEKISLEGWKREIQLCFAPQQESVDDFIRGLSLKENGQFTWNYRDIRTLVLEWHRS